MTALTCPVDGCRRKFASKEERDEHVQRQHQTNLAGFTGP